MAETKEIQKRAASPIEKVRNFIDRVDVTKEFKGVLGDRSQAFCNSIVNVVSGSKQLQAIAQNNPGSIVRAAMKGATLNLPIDPSLGQAAIVPYGNEAVFQIMYRGVIQLCIRSGRYKTIHCSEIYTDELKSHNPITGEVKFKDPNTYKLRYQVDRDKHVIGHYLYFRLNSGFEISGYMTHQEALAHGKKYSKAYQYDISKGKKTSAWSTNPIQMGNKTIIIRVLKLYGIMSIEMQDAFVSDRETFDEAQVNATKKIEAEAGSEPIDTNFEAEAPDVSEEEAAATKAKVDAEKEKLAAAEKKAKAKAAREAKKNAKSKDSLPKYHCDGCGKDFDEATSEDVVKGTQHSCLSWNTRLNEQPGIDPDIMDENN